MDDSDPTTADTNPYRPPLATLRDDDNEDSIRRDGRHLVVGLYGGLHSMCAHCGSARDLQSRSVSVVWRNPVGCFTTVALGIAIVLTAASAEHIPISDPVVGWVILAAALGVIVVNVVWRSRRIELNYALCLDCRARRGRWLMAGAAVLTAVVALAFLLTPMLLVLLLPMYFIGARFQPANIKPTKIIKQRVWLRGMRETVLDRFESLDVSKRGV